MNKFRLLVLLSLLATGAGAGPVVSAQEPSGVQERVTVTLVQVDALVIDKDGKTVPGLTKADFELILGGQPLEVATLDEACQIGATADPLPIEGDAPPAKVGDGIKRRIVFAFDYYFLETTMRAQILDAARSMLEFGKTDDDEVMIVALAYGVRVEQRFTNDLRQLVAALARMEHDVTLWARQFPLGASGEEYFDDLVTLMDVLEGYDGSKAVVLFSQARHIQTSMRDIFYNDVAMHALSARSAIYPANPDLLSGSGGGSDSLTRLANQSGGRMPFFTNDVSLPYRQAQRDLSCRYTVGAYLDNTEGKKRKSVAVRVKNDDYRTRHPEMIKLFTDEEKQENRSRAAFVDPEPYENPLVRADVYPVFPASRSTWDTLLMLTFPMPVAPGGADIEVAATLMRGATRVDKAKRELHIDPPPGGGDVRPVTVFADTKLKDGDHRLTVVLTEPGTDRLVTAEARFQVPPVFEDLLILRGPLFARTIPGGLFVRGDADKTADTKLDEILGEDKSFEPLLVNQIATSDELLYYWNACVLGKLELNGQAVVKRTLMDDAGEIVHRLPELPLELEPQARVKGLQCHSELETVAPNRIPAGDYQVDILITYENGDVLAHARAPLQVTPAAN